METTRRTCKLKIMEVDASAVWVRGHSGVYIFEAKVYDVGATDDFDHGRINSGRIGDFIVWTNNATGKRDWVVEYRGGLYIGPSEPHQAVVSDFIGWLEAMPESSEVRDSETFELDI